MKIGIKLKRKNDWPPFDVEHLWVEKVGPNYEIRNCPFFVKGLSIGDIVSANMDQNGYAKSWRIITRSDNTNIWIYTEKTNLLDQLVVLGCSCEGNSVKNFYSLNVPGIVSMASVDEILTPYEENGTAEVVISSLRH